MSERNGVIIIGADMALKGEIRNASRIDIYGYVEGDLSAGEIHVHPGGTFYGKAKAATADVAGFVNGDVVVDGLIAIRSTGVVNGNVHYGRLAMEAGANLSAEVRNVPPRLAGDFEVSVLRGRSARITTQDVSAIDPDDAPTDLRFTVSNENHGRVRVTGLTGDATSGFTQADLIGGRVLFVHDGSSAADASFDVLVTDSSGATSGQAQTVKVSVRAAA
jgi:cytoskeletal protein CcmA (bactofilin family)